MKVEYQNQHQFAWTNSFFNFTKFTVTGQKVLDLGSQFTLVGKRFI
jgi:hypothetical protein